MDRTKSKDAAGSDSRGTSSSNTAAGGAMNAIMIFLHSYNEL